tara:strand:+ start:8400 stop:9476 length:1077 start_codon:yes stop_codon:yes gene_type:complete
MFKKHILSLKRYQTSENRDVLNGIILDRNERADHYDKKEFNSVLNKIPRFSLNATPDISLLYKKIAKFHNLKTNNIYITQGITECMSHIIFSLMKKNDELIIMKPTYPMYNVLCKLHNVKFKEWKFNKNLKLSIKDLKKIINNKTKVIFLVNPNLPIENEISENDKKEILKICRKKGIILVYDEAYFHFGAKSEIKKVENNNNLIVMRTFSKAWGLSGIRLGYMVANKKLCDYVSKCRSLVETNSLTYQVALWAIENKIYKTNVKNIKSGSLYLRKKLKKSHDEFYGGKYTNAILIRLQNFQATQNLKNFLAKRKIYIRNNFPDPISNCIRVSLASVKKLSKFYNEYIKWKKSYIKSN